MTNSAGGALCRSRASSMRLAWLAKRLGANDVALALTLEASASNRFFGRQFGTFARSAPVPNIERTAARQGPGLARQGVESAPALQANAQPCQHDGTDQQEQRSQKLFNHVHLTPAGALHKIVGAPNPSRDASRIPGTARTAAPASTAPKLAIEPALCALAAATPAGSRVTEHRRCALATPRRRRERRNGHIL